MNNLQQGKKNCIFAFHYYHYYAKVYRNTSSDSPRLERRRHPVFCPYECRSECDGVFLSSLSSEESFAFYQRIQNEFQTCGFGLYAVERKEDHAFMGYTGLHQIAFDVDFAPGIEIGWRLAHEYWGQGYAPEAATACLEYTRNKTDIKELFSFTSLLNQRSERVMQKIGMERVREFDHPLVPGEHPLCRHVLYHIKF